MGFPRSAHATIATLVEPDERRRLDAASEGRFAAQHVSSVRQIARVVRERPVQAVLVSPTCVRRDQLQDMAEFVRRFPGVPTVAVVSRYDPRAGERLLELGAYGVRHLVDLSQRDGWERLRSLLTQPTTPAAAEILAVLKPELADAAPGVHTFFEVLARLAPTIPTSRELARRLGLQSSTMVSRFLRARLPSPKRYLAGMRLVHAARLFEAPGLSVADVAHRLEFSSPQSLGRHLRALTGTTATEFRRRYSFCDMLREFVARLVVPYRSQLRTFHPLGNGVGDLGRDG